MTANYGIINRALQMEGNSTLVDLEITTNQKLDEIEKNEKDRQSKLSGVFNNATKDTIIKSNVFNSFMEHLKKQVEFCSVIKGYI